MTYHCLNDWFDWLIDRFIHWFIQNTWFIQEWSKSLWMSHWIIDSSLKKHWVTQKRINYFGAKSLNIDNIPANKNMFWKDFASAPIKLCKHYFWMFFNIENVNFLIFWLSKHYGNVSFDCSLNILKQHLQMFQIKFYRNKTLHVWNINNVLFWKQC